jgi:putative inorganic carbon (hco3(-)) transporter
MQKEVKKEVKKESIFDLAIEMLLIALVFLVPVVFDRRVGIVFSLTKVTFIRVLVLLILTIWAVKLMLKQKHKFARSIMDFPVLAYVLCCTVATLTSVHVLTSFMGFYGRYEGLTTLWCYALLFFITVNFIKSKEQIFRVMYTVIIAGVCMSIYGVIQRMGLDPYAWGGVVTWQRVIGTIGQPNFLSAYVDMAFIIGLALLLNMKDLNISKKMSLNDIFDVCVHLFLIVCLVLSYVCSLFTLSRGGFMGLFAGTSLFFLLANRELTLRKWRELGLLIVLIVIITGVTSLNPETSFLGRVSGDAATGSMVSDTSKAIVTVESARSTTLSRLETWKSGYKIMADYPVFGIGQEVLKFVFPRYETEMFRFYEAFHVKQDRCHNEVCDMAVTRGVTTLAVYFWLLFSFFYLGIKIIKGDYDAQLKLFTASFLGASTAYLVQNQFSFGVVAITTLLWVMMGLVTSIYLKQYNDKPEVSDVDISNMPWLTFAVLIAVVTYLMALSFVQFRADISFKDGKGLAEVQRYSDAVREFDKSIKISPYEGQTWTHMAIAKLNIGQISGDMNMVKEGIKTFEVAEKLDPYNADNFYISGRAYFVLSLSDPSLLDKILDVENKALIIDPKYAEAYYIIGIVKERKGDLKTAQQMYEQAIEINPELSDTIGALSNISIKLGQTNKLIETFNKFLKKYPNNPLFMENLAIVYARNNDLRNAYRVYKEMVEADPKNVHAMVNAAFMSARLGDVKTAKDLFESAIMLDPKNVDAHNGLGMYYLQTKQPSKAKDEFNQTLSVDPNNQYAKQMLGIK